MPADVAEKMLLFTRHPETNKNVSVTGQFPERIRSLWFDFLVTAHSKNVLGDRDDAGDLLRTWFAKEGFDGTAADFLSNEFWYGLLMLDYLRETANNGPLQRPTR